nr:hypothetical protein [Tanacetum cinerariifolium]
MEEDDDEDPEEDPSEEHEPEDDDEDPEEDPNEEPEPEDEGTKDEELSEGSDETEPFKEDETDITPPPPRHRRARISDQEPLGHRPSMICMRDDIPEEDMPPQRRFVLTAPLPRCDVAKSSAAATARAPRGQYDFVDIVVLLDTRTDRKDIRLEIDVVRGQRTAYETELQEWNGHVRTLGYDAAYAMTWGTLKKKLMKKYCPKAFPKLALMCTRFLVDETEKVDKYISRLPDNIHGNATYARPKTLDDAIELANDLMDQKLRTYAKRQNDNKRKTDDSSRNNQQPHKKQNVARAYTAGPSEKKVYTGDLTLCTK